MAHQASRTTRFEGRISPEALEMIKRAAEIQGRSVSDFVATAAQEAAQKTISEMNIIRLSMEAQIAFAEALLNPPEPLPALRRARQAHKRLIVESH